MCISPLYSLKNSIFTFINWGKICPDDVPTYTVCQAHSSSPFETPREPIPVNTPDVAEDEVWDDDESRQLHLDGDPIDDSDNETDAEGPKEEPKSQKEVTSCFPHLLNRLRKHSMTLQTF